MGLAGARYLVSPGTTPSEEFRPFGLGSRSSRRGAVGQNASDGCRRFAPRQKAAGDEDLRVPQDQVEDLLGPADGSGVEHLYGANPCAIVAKDAVTRLEFARLNGLKFLVPPRVGFAGFSRLFRCPSERLVLGCQQGAVFRVDLPEPVRGHEDRLHLDGARRASRRECRDVIAWLDRFDRTRACRRVDQCSAGRQPGWHGSGKDS